MAKSAAAHIHRSMTMSEKIIYFDNASTTFPKPESVYKVCDSVLRSAGNPGRGAHRLAYNSSRQIFEARECLADFLGVADGHRLVFTAGCTQSINLVLTGLIGAQKLRAGDRVLVTSFEHNAVMRSLACHEGHDGIEVVQVPAGPDGNLVDLAALRRISSESPKPALAVFTRASNVTGALLDIETVSRMLEDADIPLLIDAAQSAGFVRDDLSHLTGVTYFAASGHKGLYGPPGIGILYVRSQNFELDPPYCGGTGSRSDSLAMPTFLPDRLEPGTHGVQLAAGLAEGVRYVLDHGPEAMLARARSLVDYFLFKTIDIDAIEIKGRRVDRDRLVASLTAAGLMPGEAQTGSILSGSSLAASLSSQSSQPSKPSQPSQSSALPSSASPASGLTAEAAANSAAAADTAITSSSSSSSSSSLQKRRMTSEMSREPQYLPVVVFSYRGLTADRVADWLDTGYGIAIRAGLHCAVSAHKVLNSEKTGLARVSFSSFNTKEDVDQLVQALQDLSRMPA
ncbi:MAG: aminotransferase class V-fold PLP-dependent enzyme [Candidatus Obscuribacter phosphatis]|uniref:Aminotransferase class V-fold PLP-dependent enzyme n=1 Tax=Candidatus Obscuribacter phosphatis TaxID=1906157 RepID=A0A8J7PB85_9BACT|nr:aminotransferase class V-fold PLP-dependent enzyme [Candidatus Obscuribacter phosphatis]